MKFNSRITEEEKLMRNFDEHKSKKKINSTKIWKGNGKNGLRKLQPSKMSETYALDFRFNAKKKK